jgi:hypothetical protein
MTEALGLLRPGDTCWRVARADRMSPLVENATYFRALRAALLKAERQILILGWNFDARTVLEPDERGEPTTPDGRIGELLKRLSAERPELEIRILAWRAAWPIVLAQDGYPPRNIRDFKGTRIRFRLQRVTAVGACHHQKLVVIDDRIAFCGGGDISVDRWDSDEHRDVDGRRTMPNGHAHVPRHEVMSVISGPPGRGAGRPDPRALGEDGARAAACAAAAGRRRLARPCHAAAAGRAAGRRAHRAGSHGPRGGLGDRAAALGDDRRRAEADLHREPVPGLAADRDRAGASPAGPARAGGGVVTTWKSPSWFDQMTMDRTRAALVGRLRAADVFGRFRAYCPKRRAGRDHRPLQGRDRRRRVPADRLGEPEQPLLRLRHGVRHRAGGARRGGRGGDRRFRSRLIGHWFGLDGAAVDAAIEEAGGRFCEAFDLLTARHGRLDPVPPYKQSYFRNLIALHHLGDPVEPWDSWQPWLRLGKLRRRAQRLLGQSRR